MSESKEDKIGRPRMKAHGGADKLLYSHWLKICRQLKSLPGGDDFLRQSKATQEKFFTSMAIIAVSTPDALIENEVLARMFLRLYSQYPDLTLFSVLSLRKRVVAIEKRGPDYWRAGLGYTEDKMEGPARHGARDVRKAAEALYARVRK